MRKNKTTDFTSGSIPRHLIAFAIPMLLGNLLQALYNIVDTIWVGRFLGLEALAAVSVSFPIILILVSLVIGITIATTTLVGQYYGANRKDLLGKAIGNSMILLTLIGIIITLLGIRFNRSLLLLINVPPEILDTASSYLETFISGLLGMFWYNGISAILRGLGDSRTPLKFLFYSTFLNILLDPLLIFGPGPFPTLGVNGAALATIIAQGVSALISLRYLFFTSHLIVVEKSFWSLDLTVLKLIFKIGLPSGIQQMIVSLSALVVRSLVNRFGSTVVAALGVANIIEQFAIMPAMSIGMAVTSLVAQNLGAEKNERVTESVRWSSLLTIGTTSLVSLAALLIPRLLLYPFTDDPRILVAASRYLHFLSFAYIPLALMFTLGGVMRGAGDTLIAMIFNIISLWLIRVPLSAYLSALPALGIDGVWLGMTISPFIAFILNYLYFRSGKWKKSLVKPTI